MCSRNIVGGVALSGSNSFANITTDIADMEKMRARLKHSEREKNTMKIRYEEKLAQYQQKIRQTEIERDQVLASLGMYVTSYIGRLHILT